MRLEEADYETTLAALDPTALKNNPDSALFVRFYMRPWQDQEESEKAGRPIFKDREFIEIIQPGNRDSVIDRPVKAEDRKRFAYAYLQFKATGESAQQGTPLEAWPVLTRSQVEELKYFKIHTVEQLVNAPDANIQHFAGIIQLREKARVWLQATQDSAHAEKLAAEMRAKDERIQVLEQNMEAMAKRLKELEEKKK